MAGMVDTSDTEVWGTHGRTVGAKADETFLNNLLLENGHAVRKDGYALFDWETGDFSRLTS